MDTDDLSQEAYKATITEADKFNDDLTLQFGLLAGDCKDETEYLLKAKQLIKEIGGLSKPALSDMFFDSPPKKEKLDVALGKILANIVEVENIPVEKRHFDF